MWEELWHAMPQSGRTGVTVHSLLRQYEEKCQTILRKHEQSPPVFLPVSFGHAKNWLLCQQRKLLEPLESGAMNEANREVATDLNRL